MSCKFVILTIFLRHKPSEFIYFVDNWSSGSEPAFIDTLHLNTFSSIL
jgi:hypothetical protein